MTQPNTMRILCLGDSLTRGTATSTGGYRGYLIGHLLHRAVPSVFVGTQWDDDPALHPVCGPHEGHDGWWIAQAVAALPSVLAATNPDVLLVLLGTNDLCAATATDVTRAAAPGHMTNLLTLVAATLPNAWIVVGTVPTITLNSASPGWANTYNAALNIVLLTARQSGKKVMQAHTGEAVGSQLADCVHPTPDGYVDMAEAWVTTLDQLI